MTVPAAHASGGSGVSETPDDVLASHGLAAQKRGDDLSAGKVVDRAGERVLYAWCAWDILFLPARLGQAARVTSACPVTDELIQLTVTPQGITETSHPGAVVSFLVPDGPFDSGVIESFCHFVHFFASRHAGQQWAAGHPGTFLLTLGEAAGLATRANQRMFPDVLGAHIGRDCHAAGTPEGAAGPALSEENSRC